MSDLTQLILNQAKDDLRAAPGNVRRAVNGQAALDRAFSIDQLRTLARRRVPGAVFDFLDGAANDEVTAAWNREDLDSLALVPKLLRGEAVDTSVALFGRRLGSPFIGAPTGLTGMVHPAGEIALAKAFHAHDSIYTLSTTGSKSVEDVTTAAPGPLWFQMYMWRDKGLVKELLSRADAAGCEALVVTADVPVSGSRERDKRNRFGIPPRVTGSAVVDALRCWRWTRSFVSNPALVPASMGGASDSEAGGGAVDFARFINDQFDPAASWRDVEWLRDIWPKTLLLKGVLDPQDAITAKEAGCDGVIVSNHGGRQLDTAVSTTWALPRIAEAIEDTPVLVDGGIRRGGDAVKLLALGARACLIGRAPLYGLAAGGEAGVRRALTLLHDELRLALALVGRPTLDSLDASAVVAR
jgi:L-lactate dehydrogenase (cytochrome)